LSFTGKSRHTIDAKGRLIVPARMREELTGGEVVLSAWLDGCIALWSRESWDGIEQKLRELGSSTRAARAFQREIASSAHPDAMDKQGRVTVPQHLREHAGITRDVMVTGALNHGELWSPERWEREHEHVEEGGLEQFAEGLDF
jgi:MraZ protein